MSEREFFVLVMQLRARVERLERRARLEGWFA